MPAHAPTAPTDPPVGQHLVGEDGGGVRQQALLRQPHGEQSNALTEPAQVFAPVEHLLFDGGVPHDGARHQLREHGYVHAEVKRVSLRRDMASVHVDHVAHGLQRVEADSDGKRQLEVGDNRGPDDGVHVMGEEPLVFEEPEHGQVENEACRKPKTPVRTLLIHLQTEEPVGRHGGDHQEDVGGLSPCVENQGGGEQKDVLSRTARD